MNELTKYINEMNNCYNKLNDGDVSIVKQLAYLNNIKIMATLIEKITNKNLLEILNKIEKKTQ